ncbi:MAG TPA: hypothetical protein VGN91_13900 [Bosea sp. (in: a-proteobacteria)]|jgi:quercetin dioxygenase-like cupin family protein|nr:hypothetical protein [Bosea sp. (in: a-proteobacteria)]
MTFEAVEMSLVIEKTSHLGAFGSEIVSTEADLGLARATRGQLSARRVCLAAAGDPNIAASSAAAWFTFGYVLKGQARLSIEGETIAIGPHDALCQVPLHAHHMIEVSAGFEFFELQARDCPEVRRWLPTRPRHVISFDTPESHVLGTGPRSFFDYRDLGAAEATDRRIEAQAIRAVKPREGGTGWHTHTMAQMSFGLGGWALLGVEGAATPILQERGDALCIPAGAIHNAGAFSREYAAIQVQIPGDYETIACAAPPGFAGFGQVAI